MTIKKSDFLLNFMSFCLGATVGRRIGDPYLMRHLAAKSAYLMLVNLPHYEISSNYQLASPSLSEIYCRSQNSINALLLQLPVESASDAIHGHLY
jgi:hypothetical protein